MHSHSYRWAAASAVVAALFLAAATPPSWATDVDDDDRSAPVVPLKDARLKIEMNATDRDVGVQLFIDADQWKSMDVYDPSGRLVFRATTRGSMACSTRNTRAASDSGESSSNTGTGHCAMMVPRS